MPRILPGYREEVRKKIVEESYGLFLEKGFHGTTMEDIADRLGVTKPALYQYFPGKDELYAAVAEHGREELASILERSFRDKSLEQGSREMFDSLVRYVPQFNGIYGEMLLLAAHSTSLRQILIEDRAQDLRVIEQFIARLQENGQISRTLNPRTLAVTSDALVNGLLLDIMMGMDKDEAREIWLHAMTRLVQGE